MSGQLSSTSYEQPQSFGLEDSDNPRLAHEVQDNSTPDPIAQFLENHGYKLMANHEGQLVTVAEAMDNCPPFRRLVEAMGESALTLTASRHPEQKVEEEAEETDEAEPEEGAQEKEKPEKKLEAETEKQENDKPKSMNEEGASEVDKQAADKPEVERVNDSEAVEAKVQPVEEPLEPAVVTRNKGLPPAEEVSTESVDTGSVHKQEPIQASPIELKPNKTSITPISAESKPIKAVPIEPEVEATVYPIKSPTNTQVMVENNDLNTLSPKHEETSVQPETAAMAELPAIESESEISIEANAKIDKSQELRGLDLEGAYSSPVDEENTAYALSEAEEVQEEIIIPYPQGEKSPLVLSETEYESLAAELSVPVEEVETTIHHLKERIEALEPEEAEIAHQMLDEIADLPAKLEASAEAEGGLINTEEVREELEKLFTNLFDQVGIEYTPELLDTFVELSLKHYLEETEKIIAKYETITMDVVSRDRGTHEVIKQLLVSISSIRKAILQACYLGKSALRLYSQQPVAFTNLFQGKNPPKMVSLDFG